MTGPDIPASAYTDAPPLHPNLFIGNLQLLAWLLFHPSAWRNHVAGISRDLQPDFCLADLRREQWRNPDLQWLLVQVYGISFLLFGIAAILAFIFSALAGNTSIDTLNDTESFAATVVTTYRSIAFPLVFVTAMGLVFGLVLGMVTSVASSLLGGTLFSVTSGLILLADFGSMNNPLLVAMLSAVAILSIGVVDRNQSYPLMRQVSGVVIGCVIGGLAIGLAIIGAGITGLPPNAFQQFGISLGVTLGLVFGCIIGIRTSRWRYGMSIGVGFALLILAPSGFLLNAALQMLGSVDTTSSLEVSTGIMLLTGAVIGGGLMLGLIGAVVFALPYTLARRIAGPWAAVIASAIASTGIVIIFTGLISGWFQITEENSRDGLSSSLLPILSIIAALLVGLSLPWWRPIVFYPLTGLWSLFLLLADERRTAGRPSMLRWHPAFWDEYQRLRLLDLDEHLLLVVERNPAEGRAAIDYLSTSRQRWAAQVAQIKLDARLMKECTRVTAIGSAHRSLAAGDLEGPASALLRSFSRVSQDVDAALNQGSAFNQRLALSAVEDRLDGLLRELTRSSEPYAVHFRPIATMWRQIVADYRTELGITIEAHQEIDSPYVIGVPLTEQQEIFVGRTDISARIEQLLLDRRRPPLLLYGQRRMGKTSLLNNLGRLLPSTIVPLFVDLQGAPSQASDHAGMLYNIARRMISSSERQRGLNLPPLMRESLASDPFTTFDEWLDSVEQTLGEHTALLLRDEFEALDSAFSARRFDEERVLGMLRNLIQHRPKFKVLLAGSHTLDEVQRWSNYLINAQLLKLDYLKEAEARQLVEAPIKDFTLRYEPDASQRVLDLTHGHPFLLQLLCAEIVALKNEQDQMMRRLACCEDVEIAVSEALNSGNLFFSDIELNQVDRNGVVLLRYIAAQGEGAVVGCDDLEAQIPADPHSILANLMRRDLLEQHDGGYRFQVELTRRWFVQ